MTDLPTGDILIVDDTPANLQVLGGILKDEGYRVRPVPNGSVALRAVAQRLPDLILLDIKMPEMDGYEVCRQLKASPQFREVPVVFLSGLSEAEDKAKAYAAGGVGYITKPFQFEEVLSTVRTHLHTARLKRELADCRERLQRFVGESDR